MYKTIRPFRTTLKRNTSFEGETIEKKIRRITQNKEPIKDGAPLIYQDRKDGVNPDMDIRSDRWEYAVDATDYIAKSHIAKRDGLPKNEGKEGNDGKDGTGGNEGTSANTNDTGNKTT